MLLTQITSAVAKKRKIGKTTLKIHDNIVLF